MPTGHGKTLIYQIALLVARTGKVNILQSNPLVVVVSPLNALISDQLDSCQRLKLKAVKMEQELFNNDDKLRELDEAEVVYCVNFECKVKFRHVLRISRDGSVTKPRSMLNTTSFDPWQRSLFSRQRTPGKEPLLAGNIPPDPPSKRGLAAPYQNRRLLFSNWLPTSNFIETPVRQQKLWKFCTYFLKILTSVMVDHRKHKKKVTFRSLNCVK